MIRIALANGFKLINENNDKCMTNSRTVHEQRVLTVETNGEKRLWYRAATS